MLHCVRHFCQSRVGYSTRVGIIHGWPSLSFRMARSMENSRYAEINMWLGGRRGWGDKTKTMHIQRIRSRQKYYSNIASGSRPMNNIFVIKSLENQDNQRFPFFITYWRRIERKRQQFSHDQSFSNLLAKANNSWLMNIYSIIRMRTMVERKSNRKTSCSRID